MNTDQTNQDILVQKEDDFNKSLQLLKKLADLSSFTTFENHQFQENCFLVAYFAPRDEGGGLRPTFPFIFPYFAYIWHLWRRRDNLILAAAPWRVAIFGGVGYLQFGQPFFIISIFFFASPAICIAAVLP